MNAILRLLKLPWMASSGTSRWITAVVVIVVLGVLTPIAKLYHGPDWVMVCAALCVVAIGVLWLLVIPNALWLARDSRALRLPGITHCANTSPLVYALLSVLAPALILGMAGGHALELLLMFTLVAAGCLCYLLLPATLGSALFFVVVIGSNWHRPDLWATVSPHPLAWGIPAALALTWLAGWCWLHLLRAGSLDFTPLGRPLAWQFHTVRTQGYFNAMASAREARKSHGWAWFRPNPDLRRMGPLHPVRAIRMALGRNLMPQTPASRLLHWVYFGAVVVVVLAAFAGLNGPLDYHSLLAQLESPGMVGGIVGGGGVAAFATYITPIQTRWSGRHAELPLLALLPGLGSATAAKRHVAWACLTGPVKLLALVLVVLWGIDLVRHASWLAALSALLLVVGCMGLCSAWLLGWLGGRPLAGVVTITAGVSLLVLCGLSFGFSGASFAHASELWTAVTVLWLGLLVWLALLVHRGWRLLQHRPHPFLANLSQ